MSDLLPQPSPSMPGLAGMFGLDTLPTSTELPDGGVTLDYAEPDTDGIATAAFDDNLAKYLDQTALNELATEAIEGCDADRESNQAYFDTLDRILGMLGVKPGERLSWPFDGASSATATLLLEAVVRFADTAAAELLPAAGPVRMQINGDGGPGADPIAQRKQQFLNYYLTTQDRGYYPDAQLGFLLLALYASIFKRPYLDPLTGLPISRVQTPYDLIMSASMTGIHDDGPFTEIQKVRPSTMRRLQASGYYLNVELGEPGSDSTPGEQATAPVTGIVASTRPEDQEHVLYHRHVMLDIAAVATPGADGEHDGLPRPYCITVDRDSREVLRVVREWKEDDTKCIRDHGFEQFRYKPGLGPYGWGLGHLLGGSQDTATTMLRQSINSFTLASFPGGLRARGARTDSTDIKVGPCQWPEVDTGGMPLRDALMPMPYKDVPASFAPLYAEITGAAQRLGSTSDLAVGDGREDAPVGTTVALIEKATRLESSTIKGLHAPQAGELRRIADLFGQAPDAVYPYIVDGQRGQAVSADFADNDDITPVSDPNVPTQTQRLALAQGYLTLAKSSGGILDPREAYSEVLQAMGTPQGRMQALMPPPQAALSADPLTEFQALMQGGKVQARPDQAHEAHIAAHQAQLTVPGVANTPIAAMLTAHLGEHIGMLARNRVSLAIGTPLPQGQLPPSLENQVALAVALVMKAVADGMPGSAASDPKIALEHRKLDQQQAERESLALQAEAGDRKDLIQMIANASDGAAERNQRQRDNATSIAAEAIKAIASAQDNQAHVAAERIKGVSSIVAAVGKVHEATARQQDRRQQQ